MNARCMVKIARATWHTPEKWSDKNEKVPSLGRGDWRLATYQKATTFWDVELWIILKEKTMDVLGNKGRGL